MLQREVRTSYNLWGATKYHERCKLCTRTYGTVCTVDPYFKLNVLVLVPLSLSNPVGSLAVLDFVLRQQ